MLFYRYSRRVYVEVALLSAAMAVLGSIPLIVLEGFGPMIWMVFSPLSAITWLIAVNFLGRGGWARAIVVGLISPFLGATLLGVAIGFSFRDWFDGPLLGWLIVWHCYWIFAPFGVCNGLIVAWLLRHASRSKLTAPRAVDIKL